RSCRSCVRLERNSLENGHTGDVRERHIAKLNAALDDTERLTILVLFVFGRHVADLSNSVESRERFADLSSDVRNLNERRSNESDEKDVHHETTEGHRPVEDCASADGDHDDADGAHDQSRTRAYQ